MEFKLQSLNDVVTNSSMEVYQMATLSTVTAIQEIIDTVLKVGGSNKKCQDLFDITIDYDDMLYRYIDQVLDVAIEESEDSDYREKLADIRDAATTWEDAYQKLIDANLVGEGKLQTIESFVEECEDYVDTGVRIVPKGEYDKSVISTLNQINYLFTINASYDS